VPVLVGKLFDFQLSGLFDLCEPSGIGFFSSAISARKESTGKWTPRTDAEAEFLRGGDIFPLDVSFDKRVFELQRDDAVLALPFSQRLGAGCVPGGVVGKSHVADFALLDEIVESGKDFLDWGHHIPDVHPVEVDIVGAQSFERLIKRAVDVLVSVPARVGISLFAVEGEFGGDDRAVARLSFTDEFTEPFFTFASHVEIGGVEEITACVKIVIEDISGGCFIVAPFALGAESHRAEAKRADLQPGTAQGDVVGEIHAVSFLFIKPSS